MLNLYMRMSSVSGAGGDDGDDGYDGGFSGPATDACATIVVFCAVAASVVIWEACAFAAMAALLLGAVWWCVAAPGTSSWRRAAVVPPAAAARSVGGLTDTAIDEAMPASPYDPAPAAPAGCDATTCCSVCLEDVHGGETVRRLPVCRHLFHAGCVDAWLRSHATCPLCRSDLSSRRSSDGPETRRLPRRLSDADT